MKLRVTVLSRGKQTVYTCDKVTAITNRQVTMYNYDMPEQFVVLTVNGKIISVSIG